MSNPDRKKQIQDTINAARDHMVDFAIMGFIETIDGKVPSNDEITAHGIVAKFSQTPLTVYEKSGIRFHDYFVWRRKHAFGLGFYDGQNPTDLKTVILEPDKWPAALRLFVDQYPRQPGEPPFDQ